MKQCSKPRGRWIGLGMLALAAASLIAWKVVWPIVGFMGYEPQNGDILFQPLPRSEFVDVIEGVTHSPYSHCGVVVKRNGKWVVIHALGTVKYTPLHAWVAQGRSGNFAVYRLTAEYANAIPRFIQELNAFEGRPYDSRYEMGDDAIYCSELVYKAYRNATDTELGSVVTLGQLDWRPFADAIRRHERGEPPLQRMMITPKHLSEADQLEKVHAFGL